MTKRLVVLVSVLLLSISCVFINVNLIKEKEIKNNNELLAVYIPEEEIPVEEVTEPTIIEEVITTKKVTTTTAPTTKVSEDIKVEVVNNNINSFYNDIINNTYNNLIPSSIKNKLDSSDVKLIATNDSRYVENNYGFKSAIAVADYNNRYIVIEAADNQFSINSLRRWGVDQATINKFNNVSATTLIMESNVLHESAHMLDYLTNFNYSRYLTEVREREQNIFMQTEAFKIVANNAKGNVNTDKEYFATLFASYILYKDELRERVPESYNYISNVFASYGAF